MLKWLFLLFCLFVQTTGFSQPEADNWYFGGYAALNFSTGNPQVLTNSKMIAAEGVATQSDKNGNLLFYTNGIDVWNRNHEIMPNGTGLFGSQTSTQSAVIVPLPGSDSIYYVFTVDYEGRPDGLCYSIVNLNHAGGFGDVVQKNILLRTPVCEKIAAVRHCNNRDIWVVTHDWNSDKYVSYLVSATGINLAPVISATGNIITGNKASTLGYLKFSADGKKLVAPHYTMGFFEMADFNTQTGLVTNTLKIPAEPSGVFPPGGTMAPYGVEYSADRNLLYVSMHYQDFFGETMGSYLMQYDVSVHDSATIANSWFQIYSPSFNLLGALQMASNKKIYLALTNYSNIHVINNPSGRGAVCNFQQDVINLSPGMCVFGFPNFLQSYFFGTYDFSLAVTPNCATLTHDFIFQTALSYDSIKWNFDDPASGINNSSTVLNPQHSFSNSGIYKVELVVFTQNSCNPTDTISKDIWIGPVDNFLGTDIAICDKDSAVLSISAPRGSSLLWNTGATNNTIIVKTSGNYWIRITNGTCVYNDTIIVSLRPLPVFTLGADSFVCQNKTILLQPQVPVPVSFYLWDNGSTLPTQTINSPGKYWLRLSDAIGCSYSDTINVSGRPSPIFTLGIDTAICMGEQLNVGANISSANYLWSTGSVSNQLAINATGLYWLEATLNGCVHRDSVDVLVKPGPIVSLGADTTLCEDNIVSLDAGNPGATYLWNTGSVDQQIAVQRKGKYSVRVMVNGCSKIDEITIDYLNKPKFTLGPDQPFCTDMKILLSPAINNVSFKWQDGSVLPSFTATNTGVYYLDATNVCGSMRDSVIVYKGPCKLIVPNAFTPNGDGKNEIFRAQFGENLIEFSMKIYNRWGQLVFESTSRSTGWDGRIDSKTASAGTYIWAIEYKTIDGLKGVEKGTVTLIR